MEERQKDVKAEKSRISTLADLLCYFGWVEVSTRVDKENSSWNKGIRFLRAIQLPCIAILFQWFAMSNAFIFLGGLICRDGWSVMWNLRFSYIFGFIQLFMTNLSLMWFIMPPNFSLEEIVAEAESNILGHPPKEPEVINPEVVNPPPDEVEPIPERVNPPPNEVELIVEIINPPPNEVGPMPRRISENYMDYQDEIPREVGGIRSVN